MKLDKATATTPPRQEQPRFHEKVGAAARDIFEKTRQTLALKEEGFFLLLAVIIGLFSGLAVVCFRICIDWTRVGLLGSGLQPSAWRVILVPGVAGLVVAMLVIHVFPEVRGSGVNQTRSAVYVYDGYIPFHTVVGKFITCALAIGSGQSLGPEDPSLQMGAGLASAMGRRLQLSREKLRLIAPVGAAAGLAAAFNSPIAAIIFVIEEVIGNWSAGVLGAVVLAAVSSVVVTRTFLGAEPLFRVPSYALVHPVELLAYATLGVVGGLCSLLFAKLVGFARPRLRALPARSEYVLPALAGVFIGFIGLRFPQVMGAGYEYMDQAMHNQFTWGILAALGLLKIFTTTASFTSGTPGGMFAPTLFVGAMLGASVGALQHRLFPGLAGPVGAYALVGMGTLFAGFLRAPMTSVFMVLEVSGNYSIILPVMISNTISYLISRRFQRRPLFDMLARDEGLDLPSMEERREESLLRVEDAMRPPAVAVAPPEETVGEGLATLERAGGEMLLVFEPSGRWAGIRKADLHRLVTEGRAEQPLAGSLGGFFLPRLHPDHSLDGALRAITDWPFLPVVHRADFRRLEGIISLPDVLDAYSRAGRREPSRSGAWPKRRSGAP